ncbi:MAG: UDP-N-acetylmuramoyl-tripeptide--D-alanyl-D-alanine ligase [Gammaproteobacteria bacterium]
MLLSEIAKFLSLPFKGPDLTVGSVSIDTRTLKAGDVFVAIQGDRLDGHQFLQEAYQKGASGLIISKDFNLSLEIPIPFLQVSDTTQALGAMATLWRSHLNVPVIGITGSCGKTSVKELTRAVLATEGPVLASEGTFNNHWGLPLTLLQIKPEHCFAVLEMGTNHPGEIGYLAKIARPNVALITNVGPVHVEGFGTLDNIAKEKSDIYAYLKPGDTAILNRDDPYFQDWMARLPSGVHTLTFSLSKKADLMAEDITFVDGMPRFTLRQGAETVPVHLNVLGQHQIANALAACAVGVTFHLSLSQIASGLNAYAGFKGRLRKIPGKRGAQLIDDSYNANPTSVKAAIDVLAQSRGKRMLILGEMAELGPESPNFHQEVGGYAKQQGIQYLWAVGKECIHAVNQFGKGAKFFDSKEQLVQDLDNLIDDTFTILVKGSRRVKMETIVTALAEEQVKTC